MTTEPTSELERYRATLKHLLEQPGTISYRAEQKIRAALCIESELERSWRERREADEAAIAAATGTITITAHNLRELLVCAEVADFLGMYVSRDLIVARDWARAELIARGSGRFI
jgi:hypothetical protein